MQSAAKVGLLVIVFIGLVIAAYAFLGRSIFGQKTETYFALFPDAGGVRAGAQVQMAGVQVGTVTGVALENPRLAKLTLKLSRDVRLPEGSAAQIPSSLIGLGETPVLILPGPDAGRPLPPGSTLRGGRANALDNILPNSKETVVELTKTLTAVRKVLENQKLQGRLVTLLETSNKTVEQLGALLANANLTLSQNQALLRTALQQGTLAVTDVRRVTLQVAKLVESGKLQNGAVQIMQELKDVAQRADELLVSMNKLVTDPTLRDPASRTAANIADISETGKRIAQNTEEITRNGAVITSNAITMTERANEVLLKASEIEDQLKEVLDKVGGFFGRRPTGGTLSSLEAGMDVLRETDPSHWRTDLNFRLPLSDSTLYGGVYDAFETNKLTLQLGRSLSRQLGIRYGIYASKPAVGVDYLVGSKLSFRSDLWDINALRLDFSARYELGDGLVGWLGIQRILKDNAPVIGIGIRR